jgi:hypothetical protein
MPLLTSGKHSTTIPHVGTLDHRVKSRSAGLRRTFHESPPALARHLHLLVSALTADICQRSSRSLPGVSSRDPTPKVSERDRQRHNPGSTDRIIGTSTSRPTAGGNSTSTNYRDASGRTAGSAIPMPLATPARAAQNTGMLQAASSATAPPTAVRATSSPIPSLMRRAALKCVSSVRQFPTPPVR